MLNKIFNLAMICAVCAVCLACVTACNSDDSEPSGPADRTVIAYMMPDGLDYYIQNNIDDMVEGSKNIGRDKNILVFADLRGEKSYILKLTQGRVDTVRKYSENLCNADPAVMQEVLQWCVSNYPANSYALSIGSHGTAWVIERDTIPVKHATKTAVGATYGNDKPINIPTLANVLSTIPHSDFILFDCCLMQSVEVAYELRKCTDYIVGSPAEIPSHGAYFKTVLPEMFNSAEAVTREYFRTYATSASDSLPVSMVKTSELDNLAIATNNVIDYIMPENPSGINMENTIYYAYLTNDDLPFLHDMNNIMLNHLPKEKYDEWRQAFDKAVPMRFGCSRWRSDMLTSDDFDSFTVNDKTFGGISMFVPHVDFISTTYNNDIKNLSWSSVFPSP